MSDLHIQERETTLPTYLLEASKRMDQHLARLVQSERHELIQSLYRKVLPGGKRLRPALCLLVSEAVQGDPEKAMTAAISLEFIHCATLIHDDVYDRDELRRGAPAMWKQLGERGAMLLGDLMFGLAMQLVYDAGVGILGKCIAELSRASFCELMREGLPTEADSLQGIIGKTGSLFRTAAHLGALTASGDAEQVLTFAHYGEEFGVAFQIADDLSDVQKSWAAGCFVGDLKERIVSFPLLVLKRGDDLMRAYCSRDPIDEAVFLDELRRAGCEEFSMQHLSQRRQSACQAVETMKRIRYRSLLVDFPQFAANQLLNLR